MTFVARENGSSLRSIAFVAVTAMILAVAWVPVADAAKGGDAPVQITMSAAPNPVASGAELTYTIVVENTGGAKVHDVVLTDQINDMTGVDETNQLVITSSLGNPSCSVGAKDGGHEVVCDVGTMSGHSTWDVSIRGKVTAANNTVLNNTATVTGTKSATTFTNSATQQVQVQAAGAGNRPDLNISVNAPEVIPPDADMEYILTVNNLGTLEASDVVVTAELPAGTTYLTSNATSLFNCGAVGASVTCSGGAIDNGANASIHIFVNVTAGEGGQLTISTAVDPNDSIVELDEENNFGNATTTVSSAPPPGTLTISVVDSPDPAVQYQDLTYVHTVTNTSTDHRDRADHVVVTHGTQGLDAASVTATPVIMSGETGTVPACSVNAPTVTCEWTRMAAGTVVQITITGQIIVPAGSTIVNHGTVNGNIKNTGVTNTATAVTTIRPRYDLTVTQYRTFPDPLLAPVRAADRFDYLITVGNSGLFDAQDVVVREPLPDGVFFDGFAGSVPGTTCGVDIDNVVTCTIPEIQGATFPAQPQGTTETITLFLIAPHAIGPITSTVTVDPANAIPEADEDNNLFTTTVLVETGIDLTILKYEDHDPVARNGTLRYTIKVANLGTQDSSGILVRDVLPAGMVFRDVVGTHNFTCSATGTPSEGQVVSCTDGIIEGTYSGSLTRTFAPDVDFAPAGEFDVAEILIDVFAADEPGTYHNEVRVDPEGAIPEIDEANNIDFEDTVVENGIAAGSYKELSIPEIVDNHDPVATSGTLEYTLTVLNTGAADAFNVELHAQLPAGSIFRYANDTGLGANAFTCSHSGGQVTCSGGTVLGTENGPPNTRMIKIGVFAPPAPGQALLEAIVDPNNAIGEADEANNEANETTEVVSTESGKGAYIELNFGDVTDNFDPVAPSGNLVYTVPVKNTGAAPATGVSFRATLPAGSEFRGADDIVATSEAFSCVHDGQPSGGIVTCTGAEVGPGVPHQVEISVFAPAQPGIYRLDLVLDPNNDIPEAHEGNNTAEEYTEVNLEHGEGGFIDLAIAKLADHNDLEPPAAGNNPAEPGETVTYTLEVTNLGTDDAFNVVVRDPLPVGVTFLSASGGSNFFCQESGGLVECAGGHVKGSSTGGGVAVITIQVRAPLNHNQIFLNQAFVDPGNAIPEADETNNSASVKVRTYSQVDLTVKLAGSVSTGMEGELTMTAISTGTAQADNVVAVMNLPVGVIPLDVTIETAPERWSCEIYENPINQVVCTGWMPGGATDEFSINTYKTAEGDVTFNAVIDPDDHVVENQEGNNTHQHDT